MAETIRTQVRLPAELHREMKEQAYRERKSLNRVIVERCSEKE